MGDRDRIWVFIATLRQGTLHETVGRRVRGIDGIFHYGHLDEEEVHYAAKVWSLLDLCC